MVYNAQFLGTKIKDKSCKVYICGPPSFMQDSMNFMQEIGIPSENVFHEYFGPMM